MVADRRDVSSESPLLVYARAVVGVVLTQRPKHVVVNLVLTAQLRVQVSVADVKDANTRAGGSLGHRSYVLEFRHLSRSQLSVGIDWLLVAASCVLRSRVLN